jgi:hypothetical protein
MAKEVSKGQGTNKRKENKKGLRKIKKKIKRQKRSKS